VGLLEYPLEKIVACTLFPWMFMPYLTKRIPVVIQLKKIEADLFFIQFPDVYIEKKSTS
jgi:hypothetical protein